MRLFISMIVAALVMVAGSSPALAEEIRVGGGAAPIENIFKRIQQPFEERTGIHLSLRDNGPDKAFMDLQAGKIDLATAGVPYGDLLDMLKRGGHEVGNPGDYVARVVGTDTIHVLMHGDLATVKNLNKDQLKGLFTGKLTNWKDVGGPDLAVVIVFGAMIPGTNKLWQARIMDGADWGANRKEVTSAGFVRKAVAGTPGAIGICPAALEGGDHVHTPHAPGVERPIIAVTKGAPSPAVQKLYDYIQGEGQKYVIK